MPDFVTITETQEIEMGAAYHREIMKSAKYFKMKRLINIFQNWGKRLLEQAIVQILTGNLQ